MIETLDIVYMINMIVYLDSISDIAYKPWLIEGRGRGLWWMEYWCRL
jgi:hypothetical protein